MLTFSTSPLRIALPQTRSRSSPVICSHFFFGIETTMPELKKCGSGTSSMNGVFCTTWAGASICVVTCMVVVMVCDSTPDFAM